MPSDRDGFGSLNVGTGATSGLPPAGGRRLRRRSSRSAHQAEPNPESLNVLHAFMAFMTFMVNALKAGIHRARISFVAA